MKQKLGLATALIHRPKLLLLDEPTGGVDPVTRQDFWQLIGRAVAQDGLAVLVSTPYMDEASRCTRLGFLQNGHILAEGSLQQLTAPLQGRIVEFSATPRAAARRTAQADPAIEEVQPFGDRFHCRLRPGSLADVLARLPEQFAAAAITLHHIRPIAPTLEDVFINLLRD
jgi:ABC-2 type transport system ATP-binding protein